MPTVRIDDDVYRELQRRAQPFVDSPNDVMRRVLDLAVAVRKPTARTVVESKRRTADKAFYLPILEALIAAGGKANSRDVLEALPGAMNGTLRDVDFEPMATGEVRWKASANFAKLQMSQMVPPLIKPKTPRGVWEITKEGRLSAQTRLNGR
jgi:hypothetical protein